MVQNGFFNPGSYGVPLKSACAGMVLALCLQFPAALAQSNQEATTTADENALSEFITAVARGPLTDSRIESLPTDIAADALSYFAHRDDAELIKRMIGAGVAADAANSHGTNALIVAIGADSLEAATALVAAGSDVRAETGRGTPAAFAELVGSVEMKRLVSGSEELDSGDLLRSAARAGDTARIVDLIAAGADVNAPDEAGVTPLVEAVGAASVAIVAKLLEFGAIANVVTADGLSPLGVAVIGDNADIVDALLEAGADPDQKSQGIPALSLAIIAGSDEIVDMLLDAGADPELGSNNGVRPAVVARMFGRDNLAKMLGGTPELEPRIDLIAAIKRKDAVAVEKALEAGADPNQRGPEGSPALVVAAAFATEAIVDLIIDAGVDMFATGANGASAIHAAFANSDPAERNTIARRILGPGPGAGVYKFLRMTDDSGRSGFVALAANAKEESPRRNALINAIFWRDDALDELVNKPDADGITPFEAAVLAGNVPVAAHFAELGIEPGAASNGVSLQDLARSRKAWAVLAELPDDRIIPGELKKGAALEVKKQMQSRLQTWGYYSGAIDGIFGAGSEAAMIAFLKDREAELLAMAKASDKMSIDTWGFENNGDAILSLKYRFPDEDCTWKIHHWHETRSNWSNKFVGCVEGGANWNANGFGYVEYVNSSPKLLLFGPDGWEGEVEF